MHLATYLSRIFLAVVFALPLAACVGVAPGTLTGATTSEGTTDETMTAGTTEGTTTAGTTEGTTTAGTTTAGTTTAGTTTAGTTTAGTTTAGTTTAGTATETDTATTTDTGDSAGDGPGFDPSDDGVQSCEDVIASDPYTLLDATIKEDTLVVLVGYSGGCADHLFGLCWDGNFAESDPVQVWLELGHEDNDDPCDAAPIEELFFDLTVLKEAYQQESGEITVHIGEFTLAYLF